jgi:RNA polymerase sigma-70 factor (ECF subfamily)
MPDLTDEELVSRCKDGSDEAFAELVRRYRNLVFGLIVRTVGDRQRAEDLSQEVFLRVYRGLPYFRGAARLSTWLYRIVINVCLQDRSSPERLDVTLDERRAQQLDSRDETAASFELRDRLGKALARLPAPQRLLIAAHYLKGVQYEELAEAFGMPLGTVKTHLYRAKRQLRVLLETDYK